MATLACAAPATSSTYATLGLLLESNLNRGAALPASERSKSFEPHLKEDF